MPTLLAGFSAPLGLHAINSKGETIWRNRSFQTVTSIVPMAGDEFVLATGDRGRVLKIDSTGDATRHKVQGWSQYNLVSGDHEGETLSHYFGFGLSQAGTTAAVALSKDFQEVWSYPVPAEIVQSNIESLVGGKLLPDSTDAWVIAGPDGNNPHNRTRRFAGRQLLPRQANLGHCHRRIQKGCDTPSLFGKLGGSIFHLSATTDRALVASRRVNRSIRYQAT